MSDQYYSTRYKFDPKRTLVWQEIVRFLKPYFGQPKTVLDLGAGYCDFINNIEAENRIAVDASPDFPQYARGGVRVLQTVVTDLKEIKSASVNVCFASNLLEHLTDEELAKTTSEIRRVLTTDGLFVLMQPNYRLTYKRYFDDPTHKKVFSDVSLENFLLANGFVIKKKWARFLPFSFQSKSRLIPVSKTIVRWYLHSPWKPLAGQMLFVAQTKNS